MDNKSILLVEDEPLHRLTLTDNLENAGYQVCSVNCGQAALDLLNEHNFPVALIDIRLPDISGIELLYELRSRQQDCSVILMTGQSSVEAAVTAMREGAYDYLAKPFKVDLLLMRIDRAFQLQTLRQQLTKCTNEHFLTSHAPVFQKTIKTCEAAAATSASVLLIGESGVGKELLADYVHANSDRSDKPIIKVNCAAIPESLLEGELFGYRRGAFTGALRDHDGLLLQADDGTLFLDEVGEISLSMQVKLLRVLQERKVRRLGGNHEQQVNFRLIAATHQNPAEMVRTGRMREDFYYRLNVIPVSIPPLRERREDIPMLVINILRFYSQHYSQAPILLTPEALKCLEQYRFPGNIRELRNMLERLQVLYSGQEVGMSELPDEVTAGKVTGSELIQGFHTDIPLKEATKEFEIRFIQTVVDEEGGNRTAAAERLGISRKTLWEKIGRH
jgi:two-component system, NtrC family, response regulator AtoC